MKNKTSLRAIVKDLQYFPLLNLVSRAFEIALCELITFESFSLYVEDDLKSLSLAIIVTKSLLKRHLPAELSIKLAFI